MGRGGGPSPRWGREGDLGVAWGGVVVEFGLGSVFQLFQVVEPLLQLVILQARTCVCVCVCV